MTNKPAADAWQDYDSQKPPRVERLIIIQAELGNPYFLFINQYEIDIWTTQTQMVAWAYYNQPEPKLTPCFFHPKRTPKEGNMGVVRCDCEPYGCSRMPNAKLWNAMQEWLRSRATSEEIAVYEDSIHMMQEGQR